MSEPRAFTVDEMKKEFVDNVREMARYWSNIPNKTPKELCDGLAFSLLSMIDGCSLDIPSYDIIPSPHADDEQYCRDNGENWYPTGVIINDCQLHEMFHQHATPTAQPASDPP